MVVDKVDSRVYSRDSKDSKDSGVSKDNRVRIKGINRDNKYNDPCQDKMPLLSIKLKVNRTKVVYKTRPKIKIKIRSKTKTKLRDNLNLNLKLNLKLKLKFLHKTLNKDRFLERKVIREEQGRKVCPQGMAMTMAMEME